jgi:hypothetical protein
VKLLRHQTDDQGFPSSVVELTPLTGRTHQLRLHMRHVGHCILGDTMYATGEDLDKADRLLLHAYSLEIDHPVTQKRMRFTADCTFVSGLLEAEEKWAEKETKSSSSTSEQSIGTAVSPSAVVVDAVSIAVAVASPVQEEEPHAHKKLRL